MAGLAWRGRWGWEFVDRKGELIEQWTGVGELARIRVPRRRRWFDTVVAATDVQNRLLGERGASRVYGPQKGLRARDFCIGRALPGPVGARC